MVHFVGAGPGAPDLITQRGAALLQAADCIIYAGSLVNPALLGLAREDCAIYNSAEMTLEQVAAVMRENEAAKKLNSCGIYTIGNLAAQDRATVVSLFGARGDTLWNYANGREADPVTKQGSRDNSYGNSVTMPRDLPRPEEADATMLALCDSVGRRLRADGKTARVVTVQLVDNAFRRTSHQTTLPNPTNSTDRLYRVAVELMRQMWPARPVRLVGVSAEKTGEDNFEQMDLFTDAARIDKQEKLDRAADALRRRFGGAAVTRATLLTPDTRKPEALSAAKERDKDKK